jgi:hypothetical protein
LVHIVGPSCPEWFPCASFTDLLQLKDSYPSLNVNAKASEIILDFLKENGYFLLLLFSTTMIKIPSGIIVIFIYKYKRLFE